MPYDEGGHYTPTGDEIEAAMQRGEAARERIAHMARIGLDVIWIACDWCGLGVAMSQTHASYRHGGVMCRGCAEAIDFLDAEDWTDAGRVPFRVPWTMLRDLGRLPTMELRNAQLSTEEK